MLFPRASSVATNPQNGTILLVALPSHYSDSSDEASVELNNHLAYTNTISARAPWHVFCFLEAEILDRLPVNDSLNFIIDILDTLTEHAQGRRGELVIWSVERPRTLECYDVIIPKDLSGFYGLHIRIDIVVAAAIVRLHCGNRQRQADDSFTKLRRRGSSTLEPSSIKVPVLGSQPAVLSTINREAPAARQPVPSGFPTLSPAGNDNDLAQCYLCRVFKFFTNLLS